MNDSAVKKSIREKSYLFWYTPPEDQKEQISDEFLLETILNYGTLDDSLRLIDILGQEKALQILRNTKGRKKGNYFPEIYHFFELLLSKDT